MTLFNVFSLLGGLALFLFGMDIMGKALEKQAGGHLQKILSKLTDNPLKGFFLGLCVSNITIIKATLPYAAGAAAVAAAGFLLCGILARESLRGASGGKRPFTFFTEP